MFDLKKFLEFQIEEIKKHKYITSQKAGYDRGREAECEWIRLYAAKVRAWAMKSGFFDKKETKVSHTIQIDKSKGLKWTIPASKMDEAVKYLHTIGEHTPDKETQSTRKESACQ